MLTYKKLLKNGRLARRGQWWDLWDIDIDWCEGAGNVSLLARRKELFRAGSLLNRAVNFFRKQRRAGIQVWLDLYAHDSRKDRLYIHSANNHNNTPWPLRFGEIYKEAKLVKIPKLLRAVERKIDFPVVWYKGGRNMWIVVPKGMEGAE